MITDNLKRRIFTSFVLLFLVFLIYSYNFILVYSLIILGILSILEFSQLIKRIFKKNIYLILLNCFFIFFIFIFCYMFIFFSNLLSFKLILFIFLAGCIASDIGGFIFGKIFKGPKLTKISPNKTYSGALGSIILTTTVVSLLFLNILKSFKLEIIMIGVITSIFCQLGDLLFSYLKRKAKVKDTGNFLPGHGGVLDRLDGIFLGIPFGFFSIIFLN